MKAMILETLFNPNPVGSNDWEAWQAQEEAQEKAFQYLLEGRL